METIEKVKEIVLSKFSFINQEDLTENASLINDLGMDSLDIVEMTFEIEGELNITIDVLEAEKWVTFGDVVNTVNKSNWKEK